MRLFFSTASIDQLRQPAALSTLAAATRSASPLAIQAGAGYHERISEDVYPHIRTEPSFARGSLALSQSIHGQVIDFRIERLCADSRGYAGMKAFKVGLNLVE